MKIWRIIFMIYDMWLDPERENPIIGMQIREEGSSVWRTVSLYTITGFTYEKDNEYELLVKKTTVANPPMMSTSGTNSSVSSRRERLNNH